MVVRQPVQEGEVFGEIGAPAGDKRRVAGQVGMCRGQPRQHQLPVAHRQGALCKSIAKGVDQFLARLTGNRVADQRDDAGGHAVQRDDGMKGGANARALCHRRLQRGIEQERPVVIDADQHGFLALVQRHDMDRSFGAPGGFGVQRQGQRRQLVGAGAQHVLRHRAGIEGVEEAEEFGIGGKQGAGLGDSVRGAFCFFGLGGADGSHHGHGSLAKNAVIRTQ